MGLTSMTETSLIEVLARNIEKQAGLETKVDFIMTGLSKQTERLDTLITAVTRMEEKQAQTNLAVETVSRSITDHETRLRVVEPKMVRVDEVERDHAELKRNFEKYKEETDRSIVELKNSITKIIAIGGCVLVVLEIVINIFVVPWFQNVTGW